MEAAGLYYLQLQRGYDSANNFAIQYTWGKGIRPDLYEGTDIVIMTATLPIYGMFFFFFISKFFFT